MASRNSLQRRLRNHIREHSQIYQLFLILGSTIMLGGTFILAVKLLQGSRETGFAQTSYTKDEIKAFSSQPEDQVFPAPIGNEEYGLQQILRFALEANGGREATENIRTLRRITQIQLFEDGVPTDRMSASIIYRKPDNLRYSYNLGDRTFVAGYNGERAWRQGHKNDISGPAIDLDGSDLLLIKQDLHTLRPLSETLNDRSHLRLLDGNELPSLARACYGIEYDLGWMTDRLYFDRKNFLCHRRDIVIHIPDQDPTRIRIEYEDFRYIDKLVFPFFSRVWIDDAISNELTIESIEINIGVLPYVFDKPEN